MHTESIQTRVIRLAVIRLDAQLDNLVGPFDVHVLYDKVLQGRIVILILILTKEHRFLIFFMVESL